MSIKKDWKPVFLEAYRKNANISKAVERAGVTRQAFYKAKRNSEKFRAQFEATRDELADDLESVAVDRAREKSDTMLIFLLKGLKPDTYGDRVRHGGIPGVPLEVVVKWGNDPDS